jgi:aminopeptidase
MHELYQKLARLAVRRGVNVQKGQPLIIRADVRDHVFIEMLVKEAYEAGALSVSVDWKDQTLNRMDYEYQTAETLCDIGTWIHTREEDRQKKHACYLSVISDAPNSLQGIDQSKRNAYQSAYLEMMADLQKYSVNNEGQWCVFGIPSIAWAKTVFPDLPEEEAFNRLEAAIFQVSRVHTDSDPLQEWEKHDAQLIRHADKLNACQFDRLHFRSGLGTDLTVGLVRDHIWVGGGCTTPDGVYFDPNIPTEEIFCMPDRNRVDGVVYASMPLSYHGTLIEDFHFHFKDGKVTAAHAGKEADVLNDMLAFDEGSSRLGEVALVPYGSPVSASGILFLNTLYDENAACHLALGMCYPENLKGGTAMSDEELQAAGGNVSRQHIDFMFGTADMEIDGIAEDGTVTAIFRNGRFVWEDQ